MMREQWWTWWWCRYAYNHIYIFTLATRDENGKRALWKAYTYIYLYEVVDSMLSLSRGCWIEQIFAQKSVSSKREPRRAPSLAALVALDAMRGFLAKMTTVTNDDICILFN